MYWYSRSSRCSAINGPSLLCAAVPSISRRRAGRSLRALASLTSAPSASLLSSLEPGANETVPRSSEPPPATSPPMSLKGAAAAFTIRLRRVCQTIGITLNSGLFRSPVTGSSMEILPSTSLSRATASFSGRLTASGLSTFSPSCSCSTTTLFSAWSLPWVIR
ncbi:hypothetical protein D3C80_1578750 [compost metagenome]